jgi:hypothetical protein
MSAIKKRIIYVGPADGSHVRPYNIEAVATVAVPPGSVLEHAAANAGFKLNASAATVFGKPLIVADKDQQRSLSVDTSWTINENMVGILARPGEFLNVLVVTAQALVKGTPLTRSAGTPGALVIAATNGTEEILAYSEEILTTSGTQLVLVRAK